MVNQRYRAPAPSLGVPSLGEVVRTFLTAIKAARMRAAPAAVRPCRSSLARGRAVGKQSLRTRRLLGRASADHVQRLRRLALPCFRFRPRLRRDDGEVTRRSTTSPGRDDGGIMSGTG